MTACSTKNSATAPLPATKTLPGPCLNVSPSFSYYDLYLHLPRVDIFQAVIKSFENASENENDKNIILKSSQSNSISS